MKKRGWLALLASTAIVASCGGDDDEPTPTPTPGPTSPAPSPGPTTPAPPTYRSFATLIALAGEVPFKTTCASMQPATQTLNPVTAFGTGPALVRTATVDNWTFTVNGKVTSFAASEKVTQPTGSTDVEFRRTTAGVTESLLIAGPDSRYTHTAFTRRVVATVADNAGVVTRYECMVGDPTLATDLPTTEADIALNNVSLIGNAVISSGPNAGTYVLANPADSATPLITTTVNTKTNRVTVSIQLRGRKVVDGTVQTAVVDLGTYTSTATITPASTNIIGTLASSNREVLTGQISGWSFGPRLTESGYAFAIQSQEAGTTNRLTATGTMIALRSVIEPSPTPTSTATPTT